MTAKGKPPSKTAVVPRYIESSVSLAELDKVRQEVFELVRDNTADAREVLAGTKKWSMVQLRLFLSLLNKTVPDITLKQTQNLNRNINELTYEELLKIARGGAIDVTPTNVTTAPPDDTAKSAA